MKTQKFGGAVALLLALVMVLVVGSANAGRVRGWELIGQATVSDARDHDTIEVTGAQGSFRRVQVKVFERPVQFREMTIHFANGEDQKVELRQVLRPGRSSRVIDVEGGDRVIRSIEFRYDAQSRGHRAFVKVYGLN
jgi:hypothetical protein